MVTEPNWLACREAFLDGLSAMGQAEEPARDERLILFLRELFRWNQTYNLTAVREPLEMVHRHLLDSLSIVSYLRGRRVIDVGSGAGLPGIPLALACPDRAFTLLESNRKRVVFLRHVQRSLDLRNVQVVRERAEAHHPEAGYDTVVARALASLDKILDLSGHLCAPGGHILAMKGRDPGEELEAIPNAVEVIGVRRLHVPRLAAERHLVVLRPEPGKG